MPQCAAIETAKEHGAPIRTMRQAAGLMLWLGSLLAFVVGLVAIGKYSGVQLPVFTPSLWHSWIEAHGTAASIFEVLRLLAIACGTWLIATTFVYCILEIAGWTKAARLASLFTVPFARQLISAAVGLSVATPAWGLAYQGQALAANVSTGPSITALSAPSQADGPQIIGLAPTTGTPAQLPLAAPTRSQLSPASETQAAPATLAAVRVWTVRPGDDFWSIAATELRRRLHRLPLNAEIEQYCDALIVANRAHLARPAEPQLIFTGQVFMLPDPNLKQTT